MNEPIVDLSKEWNQVDSFLKMMKYTVGEMPEISEAYTHTFFQREAGPICLMMPESIKVRKFKIGQVIRLEWESMTGSIYYEVKIVRRNYKNNYLLIEVV